MSVGVFLPCRAGSERVPKKNVKRFCEFDFGLIELKLKQLVAMKFVNKIYLSTNDEIILDYACSLGEKKIFIHKRCEELCLSSTSTDELISHAYDLISEEHILWTHVTSPFITADVYDSAITKYFSSRQDGYDSLMSVTPIRNFLWNSDVPINYDRKVEKWPRTQTLDPVYEVNSGIFLSSRSAYRDLGDRIGRKPFLLNLDKITAHDVDWPEDFKLAEAIYLDKLDNEYAL